MGRQLCPSSWTILNPSRKWVICYHGSESANHYLGKPVQEEQNFHQSEFQYEQESFLEEWDDYWAKLKYTREKLSEECNSLQVQDCLHCLEMIEELHMKWSRGHLPDCHSANESDFTSDNSENEEATLNWILSKKICDNCSGQNK